ncbi:MAG: hypothetical protein ACLRZ6_08435 [Lachnospiraceae bacterium]
MILSPQSELLMCGAILYQMVIYWYEHMLCDEENIILFSCYYKDEREWSDGEYRYGKDICKGHEDLFGISWKERKTI